MLTIQYDLFIYHIYFRSKSFKKFKASGGFEPPLQDSKSCVLNQLDDDAKKKFRAP